MGSDQLIVTLYSLSLFTIYIPLYTSSRSEPFSRHTLVKNQSIVSLLQPTILGEQSARLNCPHREIDDGIKNTLNNLNKQVQLRHIEN